MWANLDTKDISLDKTVGPGFLQLLGCQGQGLPGMQTAASTTKKSYHEVPHG